MAAERAANYLIIYWLWLETPSRKAISISICGKTANKMGRAKIQTCFTLFKNQESFAQFVKPPLQFTLPWQFDFDSMELQFITILFSKTLENHDSRSRFFWKSSCHLPPGWAYDRLKEKEAHFYPWKFLCQKYPTVFVVGAVKLRQVGKIIILQTNTKV